MAGYVNYEDGITLILLNNINVSLSMPAKPVSLWSYVTATPSWALDNAQLMSAVKSWDHTKSYFITFLLKLNLFFGLLWLTPKFYQRASNYKKTLSICALHTSLNPVPPPVNERLSPVMPIQYILSSLGCSITPQQATHTPAMNPMAPLLMSSLIRGPHPPVHPATNYPTNEASPRRRMRKNCLWRGPFIQISPDSVESLILFLSLW